MKILKKAVIGAALSALLLAGGATVAHADGGGSYSWGGKVRASISYKSAGSKLTVVDKSADGYWAQGKIHWKSGSQNIFKTCDNKKGNGQSVTCSFSIPKGAKVDFAVTSIKGNDFHGGPVYYDTAK